MKIVVLNINQGTVERGTEIFWKNLSRELGSRGAEVKILSSKKRVVQNKTTNFISKVLRRFYLDGYSLYVLLFSLSNIKKIIDFKPDVAIPTNGGWQVIIIRLMKRIGLIDTSRIVIIGHAGIGHDDEFNLSHGGADLFVALTKEQEERSKKINSRIKIKHIPNGVDTKFFAPVGEKYDYKLEKPIFLTVASFEKYKNIESTINAISELGKGSLVILGSGAEERSLKILCDEKLKGRYLIEKIYHKDLPRYYRGANVFTLVSGHQEAFGLVYLEALSCGLPVVATNDSKRHEIIGDAGIFVDPENINEYKSALMKAVVINWGDKPVQEASKFSWEKIGEKYYELFSKLVIK